MMETEMEMSDAKLCTEGARNSFRINIQCSQGCEPAQTRCRPMLKRNKFRVPWFGVSVLMGVVLLSAYSVFDATAAPASEPAEWTFRNHVQPVLSKAGCNSGG